MEYLYVIVRWSDVVLLVDEVINLLMLCIV